LRIPAATASPWSSRDPTAAISANDLDDVDADVDTENDDDKVRPFIASDSLLIRSEATEKSVGW
jgi:hypothetical protein